MVRYNCFMKTFWFQIIGLMLLIVAATFLVFNQVYLRAFLAPFVGNTRDSVVLSSNNPSTSTIRITSPDGLTRAVLKAEIADSKEERTKGLGYRDSLATDSGLLFIHDNSQKYTYWMKGMRFPIDIMWISDDTIADITSNVPPPVEGQTDDSLIRYSPNTQVNRVLETNSGFISTNNIQVGDKIIIN